jgi:hypothetical protein
MQLKKLKNLSKRIKPFLILTIKEEKKMKEHKNITPKLDDLKKEHPFKVPEGYFNDFPVKMAHLIAEKQKVKKALFSWDIIRSKLIPALAISGIALLAITTFSILHNNNKELSATELAEVYTFSALNESSEADLILELQKVTQQSEIRKDTITIAPDNFTKEAIDYLKNENIDLNTVIDAL